MMSYIEPVEPKLLESTPLDISPNPSILFKNNLFNDKNYSIIPPAKFLNTKSKNYLIKIDDDYKLVSDCHHLSSEQLEKVISTYYSKNELNVYPVANNINLLSDYICNSNSFLKNNEINPEMFISYFSKFDEMIDYLNVFGSSQKFTFALHNIGKSDSKNIPEVKPLDVNHFILSKNLLSPVRFDTTGSYINDNVGYVDDIAPYSGKVLDEVDNSDYEYGNYGNYMTLDNFGESLLEFNIDYNIYFNNQFNNILIVESRTDFIGFNDKIKKIFPEIIFVAKERLNKGSYEDVIKLTSDVFVNVEDVSSKLNKLLHDKVIDSKLSIDEIKFLIKKYFQFDTNPEHCIKFTNIWEIISSELKVSESFVNYTKRQLPVILQDLGLNKKRLADGIYWYGLVRRSFENLIPKDINKNCTPIPTEEFKTTFDKYIMDRDSDLQSIIASYPSYQSISIKNESNLKEINSIVEFIKTSNTEGELVKSDNEVITDQVIQEPVKKQPKTKLGKKGQTKVNKGTKGKKESEQIDPVSSELNKLIVKSVNDNKIKSKNKLK